MARSRTPQEIEVKVLGPDDTGYELGEIEIALSRGGNTTVFWLSPAEARSLGYSLLETTALDGLKVIAIHGRPS